MTVSIQCDLVERLSAEGNSLTITLQPCPEPLSAQFHRLGPSSWSSRSDDDEPPPTYQDVMDGRVKSCNVDPGMPPLEKGAMDAQPTERPVLGGYTNTNIFTSRPNNNPCERGLFRKNNKLRGIGTFLGRGRQFESEWGITMTLKGDNSKISSEFKIYYLINILLLIIWSLRGLNNVILYKSYIYCNVLFFYVHVICVLFCNSVCVRLKKIIRSRKILFSPLKYSF